MKNLPKFLALVGPDAVKSCVGTQFFPSVLIAQMILEGGGYGANQYGEFGLSYLAYKYNNYAGIKAWGGYTGKTVEMKTGEETNAGKKYTIMAKFCHFKDIADFFDWRKKFLLKNTRYSVAGVFSAKTYYDQIVALKKAGYATDTAYVSKVDNIVKTHKLTVFDDQVKKKS